MNILKYKGLYHLKMHLVKLNPMEIEYSPSSIFTEILRYSLFLFEFVFLVYFPTEVLKIYFMLKRILLLTLSFFSAVKKLFIIKKNFYHQKVLNAENFFWIESLLQLLVVIHN